MKRAGGISSGSSLSVTSSLSNEANTNLIAHNNDRLPLRTSSLGEETKTNLIAHNNNRFLYDIPFSVIFQLCILPRSSGEEYGNELLTSQKDSFLHALLDIFVNVPSFCQYPQTRKVIFSFVDFSHSLLPHVQNVQRLHLSIQVYFLFLMP